MVDLLHGHLLAGSSTGMTWDAARLPFTGIGIAGGLDAQRSV